MDFESAIFRYFELPIFYELLIGAFLFWLLSLVLKRVDFVDVLWGTAFVYVAIRAYLMLPISGAMDFIFTFLVVLWGLRLAGYLFLRMKPQEDKRYQGFREKYGKNRYWWISLFQTFFLQAILVFLISKTLRIFYFSIKELSFFTCFFFFLGLIVWVVGFVFETIADYQLYQFKKKSRGLCTQGLWGVSRHPNYFGEFVVWWGFGLMAFSTFSFGAFVGPIIVSFLLLRVSGVPMLDRHMKSRSGFDHYKGEVPKFFPRRFNIFK
ncbi:DUF1295 domain-containing protein [Halosquirtibacter laminarini]|uniref:DUF1295 domain-containing protein n=1 Tax=Halosquirtibacter laminarini TaxID=3374600 RepID=A0AC61NM92_9BACT|nr:DUF1295 domain-containing protein [Prolixibacteraceae bacterium]